MALFIAIGAVATLGVYGVLAGATRGGSRAEWLRAFGPMATMALGSLLVAIAYKHGPASLVTPLAGAYPVVTLGVRLGCAEGAADATAMGRHRRRARRHGAHDGRRRRLITSRRRT